MRRWLCTLGLSLLVSSAAAQGPRQNLQLTDVFALEYAADPQLSPDGARVVYVRTSFDIQRDRKRTQLWSVASEGGDHRPLGVAGSDPSSPRFSPDGGRLAYVADEDGRSQIFVRWLDGGQTARLAQLPHAPAHLVWSPDGTRLAFTMFVPQPLEPLVKLPGKPEGAVWAEEFKVIRSLNYRHDGEGYLREGFHHLFVLPAEGGTPRQLTTGDFHHRERPVWTPDGASLIFAANRHADADHRPLDTEVYSLALASGQIRPLTNRRGPDQEPALSPDGRWLAYVGFDDRRQGYQVRKLYVQRPDGKERRALTEKLDRDVRSPLWDAAGEGLYFLFDDSGDTKLGYVNRAGETRVLAGGVGGTTLGRPYASGAFSVAGDRFAFTHTNPLRPSDVAVGRRGGPAPKRLTQLNEDLFAARKLGAVEEIRFPSSHDQRPIQGWLVKPPDFDPSRRYPLLLEIHGGPFANYGARFATELQLYAAAGYVVLYVNPRGSTGYGEEFGNLIHHAYPGHDYDDLMSGVDAAIARGYVDPQRLYVTGGSGGGVLSSWIVGRTNRFRAAVVVKPVINWYSFALTSDVYSFFYQYWFPGPPWEHAEHYLKRSPISQVGQVQTPTMLITGEADHRTPISETEQFYQALQLRQVPSVLIRVPGAPHDISQRPSHQMAQVAHVLAWFARHAPRK